jgi:hypothetical protein
VLYYKFAEKIMQNRVREAILHLHVLDSIATQEEHAVSTLDDKRLLSLNIQISRVSKRGEIWSSDVVTTYATSVTRADEVAGIWIKVNVTQAIADWFALPRNNLGLVVKTQDSERRKILVPNAQAENTNTVQN